MKNLLLLISICLAAFGTTNAQTHSNAVPWDVIYQMKSGDQQVIKGEKGKSIEITFFRYRIGKGIGRAPELTLKKTDAKTGAKIEFNVIININTDLHYIIKEGDELEMVADTDELVYLSGYVYDVHP